MNSSSFLKLQKEVRVDAPKRFVLINIAYKKAYLLYWCNLTVLVEKILRVQPNVRQLYLLIKAEDESCAKRRLKEEILCSDLFECLRSRHGQDYEAFMEQKISVVVGDMTKEMLAMDPSTYTSLATKLDVIVNSAATTSFDER